jgi:hypothetical protein
MEEIEKKEPAKKFFTKSRIYFVISVCFVILMPLYYELLIRLYL